MQVRNAKTLADGRVDCEIEHPVYGWIPFTADPNDVEEYGRAIYGAVFNAAEPFVPPTEEELAAQAAAAQEAARARMQLSFAQMLIGLVAEEWITEGEGDAWLTGTVPAVVANLIASLPVNQRFAAKARAVRPSVVLRNDPLVNALGTLQNQTPEQLDAFFTTYAQV